MDKLNTVFTNQNNKQSLFRDLADTQYLKAAWKTVTGDILYKSLGLSYLKGETCVITVVNPCWFSEINLYKDTLLSNINNTLKRKDKIKKIKLVHQEISKKKHVPFAIDKKYDNIICYD